MDCAGEDRRRVVIMVLASAFKRFASDSRGAFPPRSGSGKANDHSIIRREASGPVDADSGDSGGLALGFAGLTAAVNSRPTRGKCRADDCFTEGGSENRVHN